jgi:hypothetical protein
MNHWALFNEGMIPFITFIFGTLLSVISLITSIVFLVYFRIAKNHECVSAMVSKEISILCSETNLGLLKEMREGNEHISDLRQFAMKYSSSATMEEDLVAFDRHVLNALNWSATSGSFYLVAYIYAGSIRVLLNIPCDTLCLDGNVPAIHMFMFLVFPFIYGGLVPCYGSIVFLWEITTKLTLIIVYFILSGELYFLRAAWPKLASLFMLAVMTSLTLREYFKRQAVIFVCNEIIARSAIQNERRLLATEPLSLYG